MTEYALEVLTEYKEMEMLRRREKGLDCSEDSYLFLGERTNGVIAPQQLSRNFVMVRKFIPELKGVTVHGLRHTNASMKLKAGANIVTISKDLGHSSAVITSKIYCHVDIEDRKKATDMLDEQFKGLQYKRAADKV